MDAVVTRAGATTVAVPPTRLNPTDAALWDIERDPRLRTTIVAAMVFDRPIAPARLRTVLEVATRLVPRLRQRVVPARIGPPHWELVDDFAIEDHVRVVAAPDGIDPGVIAGVAAPMASAPFRRDRPLWELVLLDPPSGRSAVVLKVHHSLTDGVGGIGLLDAVLDDRRRASRPGPDDVPLPVSAPWAVPTDAERSAQVRRAVDLPWDVAGGVVTAAFHPVRTLSDSVEAVRSAGRLLAPSSAPLSPLFTGRGLDRDVTMGDLDLQRLHDAATRHGCTVNHALFAGVVGAVAEYHRELGSDLQRLRVTMPVSFRTAGDRAAGNQWAPVRLVVPTDIDDPVDRMLAMRELVVASRRERALSFSHSLAGLVQALPSAVAAGVVGGMMRGVDVTLTNVPGLASERYLAGAALERIYAFAPTAGAALNVGFVSHLDTGCIGTLSDAAAVAEPALLGTLLGSAMTAVVEAAERTSPGRAPSRPTGPGGRGIDRLSALDTAFLRLETAEAPMHIGAAFVVDGAGLRDADGHLRIDDARRHVAARLRSQPRFRSRVAEVPLGLGRPAWVPADTFDVARHVRVVSAPATGTDQDLLDLCAELLATPLDREHPLWDLVLVDGLTDGRVGIVERVHHALVDGIGGVELAAALFDLEPVVAADPRDEPASRSAGGPGAARLLAGALVEQALDPVATAGRLIGAARTPRRLVAQARSGATSIGDVLGSHPPRAPFNRSPGSHRALRAVALPLGDVRAVGADAGATVNDVVLALVAGALRRWFVTERVAPIDVHVLVPVSTRSQPLGEGPGNQVGAVLVELPVTEADPERRIATIHARMAERKAAHEGEGAALLLGALDHVPAVWYPPLLRYVAMQPHVNVVVTNVPGPPQELYFLGARIERIVPVVPLGARLGLGIAVLSYCDELTISLFADPDAMADLDVLATALADEHVAMRSGAMAF